MKTLFTAIIFSIFCITTTKAYDSPKMKPVEENGLILSDGRIIVRKSMSTGAFLTIKNTTEQDDTLIGILQQPTLADKIEIHTTRIANGIAKMMQVPHITIPKQSFVQLKHGGYHIMIMGIKKPLKQGKFYTFTLQFKHAGDITISIPAQKIVHVRSHKKNTIPAQKNINERYMNTD